jgi:hypothetical protein
MKVLYIGNERRDAQTVAKSLRGLTEKVPLAWAQSLDQCARYLAQNRDLAALVIDASIHAGKWPASLKDLRSLPLRPAIVVVVPQGTRPTFDSQAPPPDDYVINGQTFCDDLPVTVSRSVTRVRGSQRPSTPANTTEQPKQQPARVTPDRTLDALFLDPTPTAPSELEQKLASVTAALQHAERRHAADMAAAQAAHEFAATEQLTGQEQSFQNQMALEQEKRRTIEEMLAAATKAREEAERRCASALTDAAAQRRAVERIGNREAELIAQSQNELTLRAALEQKLVQADADAREVQQRHDEALTKAAGELAEIRSAAADVERALRDEAASLRAQAEERQNECERLEQACAAANTDVQRLTADLSDARRVIEVTRREFQEASDRQSTEHATAVAALAAQIAERDERLRDAALRHDAAQRASERARAELQQSLQTALAVGRHDIDQVQQALMATLEAVRATRRQQEILQTKADRTAEAHEQQLESGATKVVQQPDIAAWQQLTKDPALV